MDTLTAIGLVILALLVGAGVTGYIIWRERAHMTQVLQFLGHLDEDGKIVFAKAATWIEGVATKIEPEPALPPGTWVVQPDNPHYAAVSAIIVPPPVPGFAA